MNWKDKNVLITGATGFVGTHLTKKMLSLGANVSTFVLDEENEIPKGVTVFRGDTENRRDVERAFARSKPEIVFHLAAQPLVDTAINFPYDTVSSNVIGGLNVLESARVNEIRSMIFMASDKVYGKFFGTVSEKSELNGEDHPYSASKMCADILARMYTIVYGLPILVLRSGNIYGGGDKNFDRIVPGLIKAAIKNEKFLVRSSGKLMRDYIYVDDVIDAFVRFSGRIHDGKSMPLAINLGSEKPMSVLEICRVVSDEIGREIPIEILDRARFEIPYQHINFDMATENGWSPKTKINDGIRMAIEWYKEYFDGKN